MVRKKKKQNIVIGIVLAIALILVLSQTGFKPFAVGFSTLSLSQININSNDPFVGGQAWFLTVSQNGAGQSATLTDKISDAEKSSDVFTLTTNIDEHFVQYPIRNENKKIREVTFTTTKFKWGGTAGCNPDYWTNYFAAGKVPLISNVWCYKFSTSGIRGSIGSGNVNFKSTINVQGSGGSDSCTISNIGSTSCLSNNGKVHAQWVGSLVSGQAIPNAANDRKVAIFDTSRNGWKIGSQNTLDNYLSYDSNGFDNCLNLPSGGDRDKCFTNFNLFSRQAMSESNWGMTGGSNAFTSGSQSSGQVKINLPKQIQFPVITMRIRADLIGINIPVGEPRIIDADSDCFQTGQTGIIQVEVKNVGSGVGNFDVSANCGGQFSQVGNSLRISSLGVQESQTVFLPIQANAVNEIKDSCTITANDVNNPNNLDTRSVGVCSSPITICSEGEERASGQTIQECQNNKWVVIKTCASGETIEFVGDKLECVGEGGGNKTKCGSCTDFAKSKLLGQIFPSQKCEKKLLQSTLTCTGSFIKIILIPIVFLFVLIFGMNFFRENKFFKIKQKGVAFLVSLVIASLLGWLVFALFTVGIIISISVLVIILALKFFL